MPLCSTVRLPLVVLALLAMPVTLSGDIQRAPSPQTEHLADTSGMVVGVVWDSLIGAPLAGARVWLLTDRGSSSTDSAHRRREIRAPGQAPSEAVSEAVSDSLGRFELRDVSAGRRELAFSHPALDSAGLDQLRAVVNVLPGARTTAVLATPSHRTLRQFVCPGTAPVRRSRFRRQPPQATDSGVVIGAVHEAESGRALAGVLVQFSWVVFDRGTNGRTGFVTPVVEARSDEAGVYSACQLPTGVELTARASTEGHSTGPVDVSIGARSFVQRNFQVSRDTAGEVAVSALAGQPSRAGRAVLAGVVRDTSGVPVTRAEVTVDGTDAHTVTDSSGRFALFRLPAGTQMVEVRKLGLPHVRVSVDLRSRDTTRIVVPLVRINVLSTVQVRASHSPERLIAGFERRKRAGMGHALGLTELKEIPSMRAVFAALPGITIAGPAHDFTLLLPSTSRSGRCAPAVYVDGRRGVVGELRMIAPSDLVGIEVYASAMAAPRQFVAPFSGCGSILVWTRWLAGLPGERPRD